MIFSPPMLWNPHWSLFFRHFMCHNKNKEGWVCSRRKHGFQLNVNQVFLRCWFFSLYTASFVAHITTCFEIWLLAALSFWGCCTISWTICREEKGRESENKPSSTYRTTGAKMIWHLVYNKSLLDYISTLIYFIHFGNILINNVILIKQSNFSLVLW